MDETTKSSLEQSRISVPFLRSYNSLEGKPYTPYQVKSPFYYVFWLAMSLAVCAGQLYVGSGYREMAREQRAFAQAVYDAQMGWDAQMKTAEMLAQRKHNRTGEFE